jgi:REP element-mobilizing transposase RayT
MTRALRVEFEGGVYHVTQRGIERRKIFKNNKDRERFLFYLNEAKTRFKVNIYCYVLMNNHYHLLVETPLANLSRFMHNLNTSYTIYFNNRYKRVGPLFQGRYKGIIVDKDNYLLELSRYIHLNPKRVNNDLILEEFKWSSYPTYIGLEDDKRVNWEWIKGYFGEDVREGYKEFVKEGKGLESPLRDVRASLILGDEKFVNKIKEKMKIKKKEEVRELPSYRELKKISENEIIEYVMEYFSVNRDEIFNKRKNNIPRKVAVYLIKKLTTHKIEEIAKIFGISYTAVSKLCKRFEEEVKGNKKLDKIIKKIKNNLY